MRRFFVLAKAECLIKSRFWTLNFIGISGDVIDGVAQGYLAMDLTVCVKTVEAQRQQVSNFQILLKYLQLFTNVKKFVEWIKGIDTVAIQQRTN